jgi:hypothetical protein
MWGAAFRTARSTATPDENGERAVCDDIKRYRYTDGNRNLKGREPTPLKIDSRTHEECRHRANGNHQNQVSH